MSQTEAAAKRADRGGRYRKKPVVIEAHQWFQNGDHPDDNCELITPDQDSTTQFEPFLSEGKVVRYFRHPYVPGDTECPLCGHTMHDHGWIDTLEGGHNVCPGDWIITGVKGERYPCKPDIFEATYEPADRVPELGALGDAAAFEVRDLLKKWDKRAQDPEPGNLEAGTYLQCARELRQALAAKGPLDDVPPPELARLLRMLDLRHTGEDAYEGYRMASAQKSLVSGAPLPEWGHQSGEIRRAWQAAADYVVAEIAHALAELAAQETTESDRRHQMSQETATTGAKSPARLAFEAHGTVILRGLPLDPDAWDDITVAHDAWEAAADAVAAPLRARIAELEDERDRLSDALNDNPHPLVSSLQSQVEYFCDLVAEILAALEVACEEGALPGDGALAAWRQRAGLETS